MTFSVSSTCSLLTWLLIYTCSARDAAIPVDWGGQLQVVRLAIGSSLARRLMKLLGEYQVAAILLDYPPKPISEGPGGRSAPRRNRSDKLRGRHGGRCSRAYRRCR